MITLIPGIVEKAKIPRSLQVPFRLGRPCGEPFDMETRIHVLNQLLEVAKQPPGTNTLYQEPAKEDRGVT
ncbi:hypothetical protein [Halalkalibacter urbisdiaboli]|uniref:hypothetical protein n=1 Tax=Halalkalibacter urbisdiaboli TaxID=1960589 RepID=UPI000B43B1D6|nr:hypothetical protein [Halalkalibacter urbisdiaboli]